jgi:PelA/Pel-15E family pectate lyase
MKYFTVKHFTTAATLFALLFTFSLSAQETNKEAALKTLKKAVEFYTQSVSTEGGYLWRYSSDLSVREGENPADAQTVWVQPPGTPSVGLTFLKAYRITGDKFYLDAAHNAGKCLVSGQLQSGGWTYPVYFDAKRRESFKYRSDKEKKSKSAKDISTLDDNTTQAATLFLAELDEALNFSDASIHEAAIYSLEKLCDAQFPNGAFAQCFTSDEKRSDKSLQIKKAEYPPEETEPTHEKNYHVFFTFNDNLARDINHTFFAAAEIYAEKNSTAKKDSKLVLNEKYAGAAKKLGDFILLSQMPEPQPAWAQQYDFDMRPCWARKFEPASITGGESQGLIDALIELYYFTGDKKYLQPLPSAVAYLERSRRSDGKIARFYELKTNKPLYFTKDYKLTYSDADVPTHYAFVIDLKKWNVEELLSMDEKARQRKLDYFRGVYRNRNVPKVKANEVKKVIESIDSRGAWLTSGKLIAKAGETDSSGSIIDNAVFIRNVNILLGSLK